MRKVIYFTVLLFAGVSTTSYGLFLGQMRSAETSGWGSLNLMTAVGIFEHARAVTGTVRYGLASPIDGTLSLAILDHDASSNASLVVGGDIQCRIAHADLGHPLDMAIGGMIEYYSLDIGSSRNFSVLSVGFNYVISKPVRLDNGVHFTPYGRINLRVDHHSSGDMYGGYLRDHYPDRHDSRFRIGFNVGSVFPLSDKINLVGELQLDDQVGFIAGINFFMW